MFVALYIYLSIYLLVGQFVCLFVSWLVSLFFVYLLIFLLHCFRLSVPIETSKFQVLNPRCSNDSADRITHYIWLMLRLVMEIN